MSGRQCPVDNLTLYVPTEIISRIPETAVIEFYASIWRNADAMEKFARSMVNVHRPAAADRPAEAVVRTASALKNALLTKDYLGLVQTGPAKGYVRKLVRAYELFRDAVQQFAHAALDADSADWLIAKL